VRPLHIGDNIVLQGRHVAGIFSGISENSALLDKAVREFNARNFSDKAKSFVLYAGKGSNIVYFSRISARRLALRAANDKEEFNGKESR